MKEIPFLQHHPLLPLPVSSASTTTAASSAQQTSSSSPRSVVIVTAAAAANDPTNGNGAIGLALTEQHPQSQQGGATRTGGSNANSLSLIPLDNNDGNHNNDTAANGNATRQQYPQFPNTTHEEEINQLRGLSSTHYSSKDDCLVTTNGLSDRLDGRVCVSIRDAGATGREGGKQRMVNKDLELDFSSLLKGGSGGSGGALFESPVGTACFVTHSTNNDAMGEDADTVDDHPSAASSSYLHLRMVDPRGTVLSLSLSYPDLAPISPSSSAPSSFLLPLSPHGNAGHLYPHPGSSLELNQVCFPTPYTVAFALNPHLYCVDLGGGGAATTRVWTSVHRLVSDPIADAVDGEDGVGGVVGGGGVGGATPRKKARKSTIGSLLTKATYTLMGIGDDDEGGYEYAGDGEDEEEGWYGSIPSIAALATLTSSTTNSDVARMASLHSDGSTRIWIAEPSQKTSEATTGQQLRIPSVQRLAVSQSTSSSWVRSENALVDPPLPSPSAWDPSVRNALTVVGTCRENSKGYGYEVAVHAQCYSNRVVNGGGREENNVYVFNGAMVAAASNGDESQVATMQRLALPSGTNSVVDMAWSNDHSSLTVLLRCRPGDGDASNNFYTMDSGGDDDGTIATLAVYPSKGGSYATEPVPFFGGLSSKLSVEEELDRYVSMADMEADEGEELEGAESMGIPSAAETAAAEATIDKAGLRAILQPFGRNRPSALAVHRAMVALGLGDGNHGASIRPATILLAVRKWKKRMEFQKSAAGGSIVPVKDGGEGGDGNDSPVASSGGGLSIYHAFASATKKPATSQRTSGWTEDDDGVYGERPSGDAKAVARQAHRARWVRLLSEIRRQEARLGDALCLSGVGVGPSTNVLVRGSMISALTATGMVLGSNPRPNLKTEERTMAALDGLSMELLNRVLSDLELRQLFVRVESMLYDGASKASSLVYRPDIDALLSQVELLGRSAMARLALNDAQIGLLGDLSRLGPDVAEAWLSSPISATSPVSGQLTMGAPKLSDATTNASPGSWEGSTDALTAAASLISGQFDSTRQLSLSRLILVVGSPPQQQQPGNGNYTLQRSALRAVLYSTALCWAIHQSSRIEPQMSVLEEHVAHEIVVAEGASSYPYSGMMAASTLADAFFASAFRSSYGNGSLGGVDASSNLIIFPSREPCVALRLLAPLVEYSSLYEQNTRESAAECLLAEAAAVAKNAERINATAVNNGPSSEALWDIASKLLLLDAGSSDGMEDASSEISNLIHRVETLEHHLDLMEGSKTYLSLCCSVVLDAIQDAISAIESSRLPEMTAEVRNLWAMAFQTSMRGYLWDEALRACVQFQLAEDGKETGDYLKRLILGMVEANALGKIVDMSLTVRESPTTTLGEDAGDDGEGASVTTGVDLFDLAAKVIEEAAYEHASTSLNSEKTQEDSLIANKDSPNYWGCLYTLHGSRGNWRQAAYAMDMCGKATANSVSSTTQTKPLTLSKTASKKIMDDASLSAQACVHAISNVEKPSHRYLLPPSPAAENSDPVPSESRLLTEEDLERRAARALALRMYSMDEYSPDSVGTILKSTSRDTIDSLAMLGYYDQAIEVAAGVSSKRNCCMPGGVDVFDDALKYILCTYLVPAATKFHGTMEEDTGGGLDRSMVAQIRTSSSACAILSSSDAVTASSANSTSWVSNRLSGKALQATMAMDLLKQYTSVYSMRCCGLALAVASAILQIEDGPSELPLWLKDLCIFGTIIADDKASGDGLFAQQASSNDNVTADPAGLMRLFIKHHQYGEACGVVVSLLSKRQKSHSQNAPSTRLPEKGNIDYVPYDLIDMLWNMIDSIINSPAASSSRASDDAKSQIKSLTVKRTRMENAIEKHLESLRISEEGLKSARRLSSA